MLSLSTRFWTALWLLLLHAGPAHVAATGLWRRDSSFERKDPLSFSVPIKRDTRGRYTVQIGMGRPDAQKFDFLLSTSPYTAVVSKNCGSCYPGSGESTSYDASVSQTETAQSSNVSYSLEEGVFTGNLIKEDCNFVTSNGSEWWYNQQSIVSVDESSGIFDVGANGVLGLGHSSGNDSLFATMFRSRPAWTNVTFGMALSASANEDNNSALDFRELDNTKFRGEIQWNPIVTTAQVSNIPTDWALVMDAWEVTYNGQRREVAVGGIAILEPYFPEIRLPGEEAIIFHRDMTGAVMTNTSTVLEWTIPCDSKFTMGVRFNSQTFIVGIKQLVQSLGNGTCVSLVKGWAEQAAQTYLLGSAFAESVYIAYQAFPDGTRTDQLGFAPRNDHTTSSRLSTGLIVGISVGGAIALIIVLVLALMLWRKRSYKATSPVEPPPKEEFAINPYTPSSATPILRHGSLAQPQTNNRWVLEQGPIGGDTGHHPLLGSPMGSPDNSPSHLNYRMSQGAKSAVTSVESARRPSDGVWQPGPGSVAHSSSSSNPSAGSYHPPTPRLVVTRPNLSYIDDEPAPPSYTESPGDLPRVSRSYQAPSGPPSSAGHVPYKS